MTHEFKTIVKSHLLAVKQGLNSVLATVVDLEGSSYRKPGVRMLILENGKMIGAVSGGCVEKDILRQSESVFKTGKSKMMTYDGRYRLGCEGILYILLEPFNPDSKFIKQFPKVLKNRNSFQIKSYFTKDIGESDELGSIVYLNGESNGWEVTVISGPLESKSILDFPGATAFFSNSSNILESQSIDKQTAIVLMFHNFSNDLKSLIDLKDSKPAYLGVLGPSKRREKLLSQFLEFCPDVEEIFVENIYAPAGLNIGAETPQEIAISIVSEILSVVRNQVPMSLKEKLGRIHI